LRFANSIRFRYGGTITNVLSPSSIVVDKVVVNLDGIDPSGLYRFTYSYLMDDLKYYIGKDVLVKGTMSILICRVPIIQKA
jgi:hypothetical protein